MPKVMLIKPQSLSIGGVTFRKGQVVEVPVVLARQLLKNDRFKIIDVKSVMDSEEEDTTKKVALKKDKNGTLKAVNVSTDKDVETETELSDDTLNGDNEVDVTDSEATDTAPADKQGRIDAIKEAIDKLDAENDDHFTETGKPSVTALSQILGWHVNAKDRDEALKAPKPVVEAQVVAQHKGIKIPAKKHVVDPRTVGDMSADDTIGAVEIK